jgi:exopolysaccharide biosynthesis polyprenyl glycosylphosphotransferase
MIRMDFAAQEPVASARRPSARLRRRSIRTTATQRAALDLAVGSAAAVLAFLALAHPASVPGSAGHPVLGPYLGTYVVVLQMALICGALGGAGLYRAGALPHTRGQVALLAFLAMAIAGPLAFLPGIIGLTGEAASTVAALGSAAAAGLLALIPIRLALAWPAWAAVDAGAADRSVVLLGFGARARDWVRLAAERGRGVQVVGVFAPAARAAEVLDAGLAYLGTPPALPSFIERHAVDVVVLGWDRAEEAEERRAAQDLAQGLPVDVAFPHGHCPCGDGLDIVSIGTGSRPETDPSWIAGLRLISRRPLTAGQRTAKRIEDLAIAVIALLVAAPLMLAIAAAIRLDGPGPVLFRQRRFGLANRPIEVLKFRTMHWDQCDASGAERTVRGDPRITPIGRFLRKTSLDELPQILNVLLGHMSIIGPRPHAVAMRVCDQPFGEAVPFYAARHRMNPGITGWAQVNGLRGEVDSLEKATRRTLLDLHYVENWSLALDAEILVRTVREVIWSKQAF